MKFLSLFLVCSLIFSSLYANQDENKQELNNSPVVSTTICGTTAVFYAYVAASCKNSDHPFLTSMSSILAIGFTLFAADFWFNRKSTAPFTQNESLKLKNHAYENGPESTGSFAPQSNRIIPTGQ